jgi:hypothetical protein
LTYLLRFVQKFQPDKREAFMELERKFIELERSAEEFPKGKRFTPYSGREAVNTLIWESEFETLEAAQEALAFLERDSRHEALYRQQVPYFLDAYTEIYQSIIERGK